MRAAHVPPPPVPAAPPAIGAVVPFRAAAGRGRLPVERLRIGMPHLGGSGALSEGWALRRAAHLHWQSIAARTGMPISALRDADGRRALPSIVSAHFTGEPGAFAEDDEALVTQTRPPAPEGGWRSRMLVRRAGGPTVRIDLASRFARRDGPSNRELGAAAMPPALRPAPADRLPGGARALKARWASLRAAAPDAPPHVTLPVERADLNGVGLLYFASFVRFFAIAEAAAAAPVPLPPLRSREVHWYGNADAGDALDLSVELRADAPGAAPTLTTTTAARRRSDGALVAVAETRRGGT